MGEVENAFMFVRIRVLYDLPKLRPFLGTLRGLIYCRISPRHLNLQVLRLASLLDQVPGATYGLVSKGYAG